MGHLNLRFPVMYSQSNGREVTNSHLRTDAAVRHAREGGRRSVNAGSVHVQPEERVHELVKCDCDEWAPKIS